MGQIAILESDSHALAGLLDAKFLTHFLLIKKKPGGEFEAGRRGGTAPDQVLEVARAPSYRLHKPDLDEVGYEGNCVE